MIPGIKDFYDPTTDDIKEDHKQKQKNAKNITQLLAKLGITRKDFEFLKQLIKE